MNIFKATRSTTKGIQRRYWTLNTSKALQHLPSRTFIPLLSITTKSNIHSSSNSSFQSPQQRHFSTNCTKMAPYPTRSEIEAIFKNMETGNYAATFERISPNVDWTVIGTHPYAGQYTSLEDFKKYTLARLGKIMKEPGIRLIVRSVISGGEQE